MTKPLISFIILSYRQEAFIREAVESALAQTYSPLEIIISDDCSKDRTFEIVQQMAADYKGPHTLRLNRNPTNLGLSGNVNRATALCNGELIIGAAGDDVSVPERARLIVDAWEDSGRRATSIYSRVANMEEDGTLVDSLEGMDGRPGPVRFVHEQGTISGFLRRRKPHSGGSTNATARKLVPLFGPLPTNVIYEDTAVSFRTVLAGGLFTFIDAPLVKYRRHGQNITFALHQKRPSTASEFEDYQKKLGCELERFLPVYDCFGADAERAMKQGLISTADYPAVIRKIRYERHRIDLRREILSAPWIRRLAIFAGLYSATLRPREMMSQGRYLLPNPVHRGIVLALNRRRNRQETRLSGGNRPVPIS